MSSNTPENRTLTLVESGEKIFLIGDAYMHRDVLKAEYLTWDPKRKHWHGHRLRADSLQDQLQRRGVIIHRTTTPPPNGMSIAPPSYNDIERLLRAMLTRLRDKLQLPLSDSDIEVLQHDILADVYQPARSNQ